MVEREPKWEWQSVEAHRIDLCKRERVMKVTSSKETDFICEEETCLCWLENMKNKFCDIVMLLMAW